MSWTGWAALDGGYTGGAQAVGLNADGRLEVFGLGPAPGGSQVMHKWQTSPNNGWSGWANLGSPPQNDVLSHLEVASNADGRLEAFLRYGAMSVGELWHAWQTAPNNGWTGWANLNMGVGNVSPPIVVTPNADGRLELFADMNPTGLTHIWQTAPNNGWSPQASLAMPSGINILAVQAGREADGRLAVFGTGDDGAIWLISQTAPNNGWGSWSSLGKPGAASLYIAAVGTNADARCEIFATEGSAMVWHAWQTVPNGSWSSWASLGSPGGATALGGSPSVGQNADGRLEVFAAASGALWHIWQTAPNNGWSSWVSLGGEPGGGAVVGRNKDGRLEVFVTAAGVGGVWHRWQVTPGAWS